MAAASAAMPPLGAATTAATAAPAGAAVAEAVCSSPSGRATAAPTNTGVMRRAEAGGCPSRLISELAGCAVAAVCCCCRRWVLPANCWLTACTATIRSGVGVMRLAALPLAADSAGRLALPAEEGAGPTASATMRRGALLAPAVSPAAAPSASGTTRRGALLVPAAVSGAGKLLGSAPAYKVAAGG